jgi:ATP-dependent DNA helicase RecG
LPDLNDPDAFGLLKELPAEDQQTEKDDYLLEDDGSPRLAMIHTARRVPVYRKLGQFQTKRLREIIYDVLQNLDRSTVPESLPADLCKRQKLISRAQALEEIHFPPETAVLSKYESSRSDAHRRLIFEEFFRVSFALQLRRGEREKEPKGTVIEIGETTKQRLRELLPFKLTGAQQKVTREIISDMRSDAPMHRLIQGDVGSGKTIVAFMAMFAAMENGYQTAMMAPTEILAEQHYRNARKIFEGTGYRVELLTGSLRAAEKRAIQDKLAAGEIDAMVGTHAVIQDAVVF